VVALVAAFGAASAVSAHTVAGERGTEPGSALVPEDAPSPAVAAQLPTRRELTLPEAVQIAQKRYPGRVVQAQTVQQGNGAVHEVRIIGNDGMVHVVRVDARTGAVQ
jgi:uncharacterized membrane protein YkoI